MGATGCDLEVEWCGKDSKRLGHSYATMKTNSVMAELYRSNAATFGTQFAPRILEEQAVGAGSTDMGNVSHVVPSIHPLFKLDVKVPNHHPDFTKAAGAPESLEEALMTSKTLSMTAIDLML